MNSGKSLLLIAALLCAPGCASDPEEPPAAEGEVAGEHHRLTASYRLIRLDYNPLQAQDSVLIVEPRAGGGERRTLRVGDFIDDCKVVRMAMQIDGISAVLTVLEDDEQELVVPINP